MARPTPITFLFRGLQQVREHGLSLLWNRYFTIRKAFHFAPVPCDVSAPVEVHMQICARDWQNGLWTLFSFAHFAGVPFRLVILSQPAIDDHVKKIYRRCFPSVIFSDEEVSQQIVWKFLHQQSPTLLSLWETKRFFTLPKVVESAILSNNSKILTLDPDVAFFQRPDELLSEIKTTVIDFGILNTLRRLPETRDGAYAISPELLFECTGMDLPKNFGTGLGVVATSLYPWSRFEEILGQIEILDGSEFMLDQTLIGIACVTAGFRRLPPTRYAIEPVEDLGGIVARHYYAKTRDLMYTEAMPVLCDELKPKRRV